MIISAISFNYQEEDTIRAKMSRLYPTWSKTYVMFHFFKILGLAPFSIKKFTIRKSGHEAHYLVFEQSSIGKIYSGILIVGMASIIAVGSPYTFENTPVGSCISRLTSAILVATRAVLSIIILLSFCASQKLAVQITRSLYEYSEYVENRNNDCYDSLGASVRFTIWTNVVITIVFIAGAFVCNGRVMATFVIFPTIVIWWTALQYLIVMKLVLCILKILNKSLKMLLEPKNRSRSINRNPKLPPFFELRERYFLLCQITQDLSNFYSVPMLCWSTFTFTSILVRCFYLTTRVIIEKLVEPGCNAYSVLGIVIDSYIMTVFTKYVTETVGESTKTRNILNQLMNKITDRELVNEMQSFSTFLLHENITFKAFGNISLDTSLITAIAGSTITYLVIVIQFYLSYSRS